MLTWPSSIPDDGFSVLSPRNLIEIASDGSVDNLS